MSDKSSEASDDVEDSTETETYRVEFSRETERPSTAVVTAIAAITGCKQGDLDPLYYDVDPDALDALFRPTTADHDRAPVNVSFTYHGFDVTVRSAGIVEIEANETGPDESGEAT